MLLIFSLLRMSPKMHLFLAFFSYLKMVACKANFILVSRLKSIENTSQNLNFRFWQFVLSKPLGYNLCLSTAWWCVHRGWWGVVAVLGFFIIRLSFRVRRELLLSL